jgi:hypothetical protein
MKYIARLDNKTVVMIDTQKPLMRIGYTAYENLDRQGFGQMERYSYKFSPTRWVIAYILRILRNDPNVKFHFRRN